MLLTKDADGKAFWFQVNGPAFGSETPQPISPLTIPALRDNGLLAQWDDPEFLDGVEALGQRIAPSVGGAPVRIRLLNPSGQLKKEIPVSANTTIR